MGKVKKEEHYENINEVVENNLKLVWSIVNKFNRSHSIKDDLFQSGCIGLIQAAKKYDKSLGTQFSTFAFPYILGEIKAFLRKQTPIKFSKSFYSLLKKVQISIDEFQRKYNKEPTPKELAKMLDTSYEDIILALSYTNGYISLFEYSNKQKTRTILDTLQAKGKMDNVEFINLQDAIKTLPDVEQKVISLRYYYGYTQVEVGKILGFNQSKVSRLEKRIIKLLKEKVSA